MKHTLCTHSNYLYIMPILANFGQFWPILANLRQNRFFIYTAQFAQYIYICIVKVLFILKVYLLFLILFKDVLNTYCWIHSTYTIPSAFWKRIGIDVAHPGIDKTVDPEERRYVRYYQWVCFCLFFQVSLVHLFSSSYQCM